MIQPANILVVEDTIAIQETLKILLELHGHEVSVAANGREALIKVRDEHFDLILLDIMMPVMNGYEFLQELKADSLRRHIPVVVLSAVDTLESVVQCITLGADDYMFKPFDRVLLEARVNASLEKKRWHDKERAYLQEIEVERARAEQLLLNIIPAPISERLKAGEEVIADYFDAVTVLFADIVGFSGLSAELSPTGIVRLLNAIFTRFDRLTDRFGLEKIKTVGDSYMVVGGLPEPRPDHAESVADLALAMRDTVKVFQEEEKVPMTMRIGLSTGPVVAGVIGERKFAYDLWGKTVNTASRMESLSLPGSIHVDESVYQILTESHLFTSRGTMVVKGRGEMQTYFLQGKREIHD